TAAQKRFDIIRRTIMAWDVISKESVLHSFEKANPRHYDDLQFL
ncbi:hypothetical protein F441_07455, partial [Phytophthora nicotianae CJ01A1]